MHKGVDVLCASRPDSPRGKVVGVCIQVLYRESSAIRVGRLEQVRSDFVQQ